MVTLNSCLIWQIISFIHPLNEYGYYTLEQRWEVGLRSTYRRCRFWCIHPRILLCIAVCGEAPSTSIHSRSQQLNISVTSLRRILHKDLDMTQYKVQLVQELKPIDYPMRFRFAKWAWNRLTQDTDFCKKKNHLFRWSLFWSWLVCKHAKFLHLGHRKPVRIHWKADAPKTSHCSVRLLVQRHNWVIFLQK